MNEIILVIAAFAFGYFLNIFYITVLYHRALAHGSVTLGPILKFAIVHTGNWVTGLDPKAWTCMHRLHHRHSDSPDDPHSPLYLGVFGVMLGQLRSYEKTLRGLIKNDPAYTSVVSDLDFSVSWLNRRKVWYIPYITQVVISILLGVYLQSWAVGLAYYFGILSHPIQGWMVNSFAHKFGYRNFETNDNSKNNQLVSILVAGEGFQNNHHHSPQSARFSKTKGEFDWGYAMCLGAQKLGLLKLT